MNDYVRSKIAGIIPAVQRLLDTPFPEEPAEPNDDSSWESWQAFMANAPDRLVAQISFDYHDCITEEEGDDEKDCDDLFYDMDEDYKAIYSQCVEQLAAHWGAGKVVSLADMNYWLYSSSGIKMGTPASPEIIAATPEVLLNPERILYSNWRMDLTWWIRNDRIALVHYIGDKGDDDFQFAVNVCVVPLMV